MTPPAIKELLDRVARGDVSVGEATEILKKLPFTDLGFARIDSHRELRSGLPEVVYGEGKTAAQLVEITRSMVAAGHGVLVTRLESAPAETLCAELSGFLYNPLARTARRGRAADAVERLGSVAVVSAGTADQGVAEEACETLAFAGIETVRVRDVGVAGLHRLLASREDLARASVAIVVAGMEGALPSVVGGMVDVPVIAVPTSVGYGASFGGLAALLAMMNSCAAGVTVVNIDNGFGAAVAASAILRLAERARG
jgi:NCAIR mutase (PurE)-related protein